MNLDDRSLSLLGLQLLAITALGYGAACLRTSARTRVWIVRATLAATLLLAVFSQVPFSRRLPAQRPIMLPPQMDGVSAINERLTFASPVLIQQPESTQSRHLSAVGIWAVGVGFGAIALAMAWSRLLRLRRRSQPTGTYNGLPVRVSKDIGSPLVAGIVRPVLYVPEAVADTATPEELESILRHEAAHVENADLRWKAFHRVLAIAFWPNLILWLLGRPHDQAMEEIADAKAAKHAASAEQYASALLRVAEHHAYPEPSLGLAMARRRSNIGRRISRLVNGSWISDANPLGTRRRIFIGSGALGLLILLVAGFGWQADGGKRAPVDGAKNLWQKLSGSVRIRIVGPDGTPSSNARAWIRFIGSGPLSETYQTLELKAGAGEVDLSQFSQNQGVQLLAADDQHRMGALDLGSLRSPSKGQPREVTLELLEGAVVGGRLLRPDGSPEAGVTITPDICIFKQPAPTSFMRLTGSPLATRVVTDQNGDFKFEGIPRSCILQFSVEDPAVQRPMARIQVGRGSSYGFQVGDGPASSLGDIHLKAAGMISGRVILEGRPVSGLRVSAQLQNDYMRGDDLSTLATWSEGTTDSDGRFVLGGLGKAGYNVAIYLPDALAKDYTCAAKEGVSVEPGKDSPGQDIVLEPGALVEGHVVLKDNADPEGYPVYYYAADHPESSAGCGSAICDAKGNFQFRVPAGQVRAYLAMEYPMQTQKTFTVKSGETVKIELKQ